MKGRIKMAYRCRMGRGECIGCMRCEIVPQVEETGRIEWYGDTDEDETEDEDEEKEGEKHG